MQIKLILIAVLALGSIIASVFAYQVFTDAEHKKAVDKLLTYEDVNPFKQMGKPANEN